MIDASTAAVLDRAIANLAGGEAAPAEAATASDVAATGGQGVCSPSLSPGGPLSWDGARWIRAEVEPPVNVFGEPIDPKPIAAGWTVFSARDLDTDGITRSGMVIDVETGADPETGELAVRYVTAAYTSAPAKIERLVISEDDVSEALPPRVVVVEQLRADIFKILGRKRRPSHYTFLESAAHRLAAVVPS